MPRLSQRELMRLAFEGGEVPFLHVRPDNVGGRGLVQAPGIRDAPRACRAVAPAAVSDGVNREGWRVVWVAFVVAVFGWGVGFYGPAVYLPALHQARGWSISTISAAITAHYLVSAALITALPEAYRRCGVGHVTLGGAVLAGAGALAWANAQQPWQLVPALLLSGAGWSAMSGAALNAMVAPWFERDRPKAISIAFNGASVGGIVFVPLWTALIAGVGLSLAALRDGQRHGRSRLSAGVAFPAA